MLHLQSDICVYIAMLCVAGEGEYCYIITCNCENVFDNCTSVVASLCSSIHRSHLVNKVKKFNYLVTCHV